MKRPKIFLKKVFFAIVAIILAATITLLIKETIDSFTPESSLPILWGNIGATVPNIVQAGYEWNFLTRIVRNPTISPPDLRLIITDVPTDTPINLNFSKPFETLKITKSDGLYSPDYNQVSYPLLTPTTPGIYTYCVEAGFDKGSIIYYFSIQTKETV